MNIVHRAGEAPEPQKKEEVARGSVCSRGVAAAVFVVALVAMVVATVVPVRAKQATPPANLPDAPAFPGDLKPDDEPGFALTIQRLDSSGNPVGQPDTRTSRVVSLTVPANTPPTPFLDAGPFRATWDGDLKMPIRDYRTFTASGRGKVKVTIDGKVAFEASGDDLGAKPGERFKLSKGKNHVVVEYESPTGGDANVRVLWFEHPFIVEPLPPDKLSHDAHAKAAYQGEQVRHGRELVASLHCLRCHAPDAQTSGAGMPDALVEAPSLSDVGARFSVAWLTRWINNPKALRADTSMPRLFHDARADNAAGADEPIDPRAADAAAYLATLGATKDAADEQAPADDVAAAGGKLFANLNCVACHTLPDRDPDPQADAQRVPLRNVKAKWRSAALVEYLRQPEKHYAWTRMPNFRLSEKEATKIAAYLLANAKAEITLPDGLQGDPAKGKEVVAASGCLSCHSTGDANAAKAPALSEIPKEGWSRGCMASNAMPARAADYGLTDEQRSAIVAFAATDRSSLARESAAEFAEREVTALRCTACHSRDGNPPALSGVADEVAQLAQGQEDDETPEGVQFTPDQSPPPLTWVGEKLRPEWMASFIAGKVDHKPRPWLRARMPGFPARAKLLADGFALEHGMPLSEPMTDPNPELAAVGRKLVPASGGFSCTSCHWINTSKPIGLFEAPGIDFMYARERLTKTYYDRWIRNPIRVLPGTKMPAFADAEGKTTVKTLDGNGAKQFEALWNYLQMGRKIQPPE